MKKLLFIVWILSSFLAQSQIINIERLRQVTDTTGWAGHARLNIGLIKNKNQIFDISNNMRVQYKTPNHLWLFINTVDVRKANNNDLVSRNTQHLRHNYKLTQKTVWETFLQRQTNKIAAIKNRFLAGCGLRFKLSNKEKYKFYLGVLAMYEYEYLETTAQQYHNDWRNSSYFSFSLYPTEKSSITSTSYFQPKLNHLLDFRILSQTTLKLKVVKDLAFTTTFSYWYDQFPVAGVPKEQYKLTNGLVYFFN